METTKGYLEIWIVVTDRKSDFLFYMMKFVSSFMGFSSLIAQRGNETKPVKMKKTAINQKLFESFESLLVLCVFKGKHMWSADLIALRRNTGFPSTEVFEKKIIWFA